MGSNRSNLVKESDRLNNPDPMWDGHAGGTAGGLLAATGTLGLAGLATSNYNKKLLTSLQDEALAKELGPANAWQRHYPSDYQTLSERIKTRDQPIDVSKLEYDGLIRKSRGPVSTMEDIISRSNPELRGVNIRYVDPSDVIGSSPHAAPYKLDRVAPAETHKIRGKEWMRGGTLTEPVQMHYVTTGAAQTHTGAKVLAHEMGHSRQKMNRLKLRLRGVAPYAAFGTIPLAWRAAMSDSPGEAAAWGAGAAATSVPALYTLANEFDANRKSADWMREYWKQADGRKFSRLKHYLGRGYRTYMLAAAAPIAAGVAGGLTHKAIKRRVQEERMQDAQLS